MEKRRQAAPRPGPTGSLKRAERAAQRTAEITKLTEKRPPPRRADLCAQRPATAAGARPKFVAVASRTYGDTVSSLMTNGMPSEVNDLLGMELTLAHTSSCLAWPDPE